MPGTRVSRSVAGAALVAALAVGLLAACGASATPSAAGAGGNGGGYGAATVAPAGSVAGATSGASAAPGGAASNTAKIIDFGFTPSTLTVKAGTTVTWTNTGAVTHTVTADNGSFDSGHLDPGKTFSHTFATAGTFTYHCAIHHSMVATVTVTP